MALYTLYCFNARGTGEVARQLFQLAGQPFDDKRIAHADFDKEYKNKMPFGQLPVLEVEGEKIPQSMAIARYLALDFGFAGKTPFECAWVDALADQFRDYFEEARPFVRVICGREKGDKIKLEKDFGEPARDKFFAIVEKQLAESLSGFLVGDGVTWVDLLVADHVDLLISKLGEGFLQEYPKVLAHKTKVQSIPQIRAWIEIRPKSSF